MNSIELADELTAPIGKSGQTTYAICEQAAVTLRRQHEAIKVLRECLIDCLDDSRQVAGEYEAAYGNYRPERLAAMRKTVTDAEQALLDTGEFQ